MKYCANCGKQIVEKFCTTCGPDKTGNQVEIGSSRAMWVHLSPLLLTLVSYLILQSSELSSSSDQSFDYSSSGSMPNPFSAWWFVGKIFAVLPLLFLWLYPAVVRSGSKSTAFERRHAGTALNFQFSLFIYISLIFVIASFTTAGSFSLSVDGVLSFLYLWILVMVALAGIGILALVSYIIGAVAAKRGKEFRYPLAFRFLK